MKHIKKFNESIIDHKATNIDSFITELQNFPGYIIPFRNVVQIGAGNDIEVVDYNAFISELPERDRSTAPPNHVPFFALVNPTTKKPRLVISNLVIQRGLVKQMLPHIEDVLHHEMIHVGQHATRPNYNKALPNPNNSKDYFSDTDEIMAFAYSVAKEVIGAFQVKNSKEAIDKLIEDSKSNRPKVRLYFEIKRSVSKNILHKYHKYIYLYLEDLLK